MGGKDNIGQERKCVRESRGSKIELEGEMQGVSERYIDHVRESHGGKEIERESG